MIWPIIKETKINIAEVNVQILTRKIAQLFQLGMFLVVSVVNINKIFADTTLTST